MVLGLHSIILESHSFHERVPENLLVLVYMGVVEIVGQYRLLPF
jgi:hypothetical protein